VAPRLRTVLFDDPELIGPAVATDDDASVSHETVFSFGQNTPGG
jgi:hypothetical protein